MEGLAEPRECWATDCLPGVLCLLVGSYATPADEEDDWSLAKLAPQLGSSDMLALQARFRVWGSGCAGGHTALLQLCEAGTTTAVVLLREVYRLCARDTRATSNDFDSALYYACTYGRAETLRELRNWGLNAKDARADNNLALRWACRGGHLAVMRELQAWGLTAKDARSENNYALSWVCGKGLTEALRELRAWGLDAGDARAVGNVVYFAYKNGSAEMLRELRAWGLGAGDALALSREHCLPNLGSESNILEVLRELRAWSLGAEHVQSEGNCILSDVCARGFASSVRELRTWGLGVKDACGLPLTNAIIHGRVEVLRELRDWGLGLEEVLEEARQNLQNLVENNRVDMLRELRAWGLTAEDARLSEAIKGITVPFKVKMKEAVSDGAETKEDESDEMSDDYDYDSTLGKGVLETLRELRAWGLTAEDIRASDLLLDACDSGSVEFLRELRNWGLDAADVRDKNYEVLRAACGSGGVGTLRELVSWGLDAADARRALAMEGLSNEVQQELRALGAGATRGSASEEQRGWGLGAAGARPVKFRKLNGAE